MRLEADPFLLSRSARSRTPAPRAVNPATALGLFKTLAVPRGEWMLQTAAGSVLGAPCWQVTVCPMGTRRRTAGRCELQAVRLRNATRVTAQSQLTDALAPPCVHEQPQEQGHSARLALIEAVPPGRMLIAIAKRAGVRTINVVRRSEQREELLALGCACPRRLCRAPARGACVARACQGRLGRARLPPDARMHAGLCAAVLWERSHACGPPERGAHPWPYLGSRATVPAGRCSGG